MSNFDIKRFAMAARWQCGMSLKSVLSFAAGLSFGISMLAVVWLVCGAVMVLGAKLFYLKDYNKIEHEQ